VTELLKEVDQWFNQLCPTIDVDVMPGDRDPANFFLPQQPFLRPIFPLANQYSSFHPVPNPHLCNIEGVS
jgi:DNA polymerase delta subunit 2